MVTGCRWEFMIGAFLRTSEESYIKEYYIAYQDGAGAAADTPRGKSPEVQRRRLAESLAAYQRCGPGRRAAS